MGSRHLRALASRSDVVVTAIADPSPTARARAVDIVAERDARRSMDRYLGLEEMLAAETLDAIVIATPAHLHPSHGRCALEAGVSALIEKPLALTLEEARDLVEAYERARTLLFVGHVERFNPAVRALNERVHGSGVARPTLIETWRYGARPSHALRYGVGMDLAIHDVDLVCMLVGEEPISVRANMTSAAEREERLDGALSFRTATVARISAGWDPDLIQRRIVVHLPGERLEVDCLRQQISSSRSERAGEPTSFVGEALVAEHDAFLAAIRDGTPSPANGRDGLLAVSMVEALIASSVDGMPVTLAER